MFSSNLQIAAISSYVSNSADVKPEVCANCKFVIPNCDDVYGTSVAAPQITAIAALSMEYEQRFFREPIALKNAIIITANKISGYNDNVGYFNDKVGAGIIDATAIRSVHDSQSFTNATGGSYSIIYQGYVTVPNNTATIGLVWKANADTEFLYITDYDILVYTDSTCDILLYTSSFMHNSALEMVVLDSQQYSSYYYVIKQYGQIAGDYVDEINLMIYKE